MRIGVKGVKAIYEFDDCWIKLYFIVRIVLSSLIILIYLAVIEKKIIECKLYQVNKEYVYVVTTLLKYERDNLWLNDVRDVIVLL